MPIKVTVDGQGAPASVLVESGWTLSSILVQLGYHVRRGGWRLITSGHEVSPETIVEHDMRVTLASA